MGWLDNQQIMVHFLAQASVFYFPNVQTGFGTHPTSYAGDPALFLWEKP